MHAVAMAEVVKFARKWLDAGPHIVQHWQAWEDQASKFFADDTSDELYHGVMLIVCCVCFGDAHGVKQSVRAATPRVLAKASKLLAHLYQFSLLLEAETRLRAGDLASDWKLTQLSDGKIIVRSEFRSPKKGVEH